MEYSNASGSKLWDTTDSEGDDDTVDISSDKSHGARSSPNKGEETQSSSDSDDLSDIKDEEINSYINNDKQKDYRQIIWEMMNKKYLEDLEAKKRMAASNASDQKKKQRQKKAKDGKKAAEKTQPTVSKKRPSSRINHEALRKMFEEEPVPEESTKRARTEPKPTEVQPEPNKAQQDDSDPDEYDENNDEEQNEWDENPSYSHYNDQDEDYYYDDGDDLF